MRIEMLTAQMLTGYILQVHAHLAQMYHTSVLPSICDLVTCLCRNGFDFGDSGELAAKVMHRSSMESRSNSVRDQTATAVAPTKPEAKDLMTTPRAPLLRDTGRRASLRVLTRSNTVAGHTTSVAQQTLMTQTMSTVSFSFTLGRTSCGICS